MNWRRSAACADTDPELFFALFETTSAVAICNSCPVQVPCRQWADDHGIVFGVWGGETEQQRRERLTGRPRDDRIRACEHCGKGYTARRRTQRFCCHDCHHASMLALGVMRGPQSDCGTPSAARRHRKHHEPVDPLCRMAESLYRQRLKETAR